MYVFTYHPTYLPEPTPTAENERFYCEALRDASTSVLARLNIDAKAGDGRPDSGGGR